MREVYQNCNGTYDSSHCRYKDYIVNSVAFARHLIFDGGYKAKVEQDIDYQDSPRFIFFFPSSVELEEFASHYDEFKNRYKKM